MPWAQPPEVAGFCRHRRPDELVEVLLHLSGYVGVPLIREAILTAKEVFAEVKKA